MKKKISALLLFTVLAFGFQSSGKLPECGLKQGDHPCNCSRHVQQVQEKHMQDCLRAKLGENNPPVDDSRACLITMPDHCTIVEHYGNWQSDEEGTHTNPMPDQCTKACTRSHCSCADGPTCHFAHSPEEDPK